jgi:hypothetical protein
MKTNLSLGNAVLGLAPTELHGASKTSKHINLKGNLLGEPSDMVLDANIWLPQAAEHYQISADLNDYVLVPVPSIISDIPNTNGDSMSRSELLRFLPDVGQMSFETWKRKPTHLEHNNKDITQAKGVIFDVYVRPLSKFQGKHVKVVKLCGFDRTKDPRLVQEILDRQINSYSMGMRYAYYECSICGNRHGPSIGKPCVHINPKKPTWRMPSGDLAYRQCAGIRGFELSAVKNPAYTSALSDHIMRNF